MLPGMIVGSIFSALLAAFGLYRLYQYYNFYRRVYSASAWPEVAGTVVGGHTAYTRGTRGGRYYYAVLDYQYVALGGEYMGVLKKNAFWGLRQAKRLLAKYPPESALRIHYNPAQPREHVSMLEKGRSYLVLSLLIFLLGFLGVLSAFVT